jgi:alcohol dehydrogenase
VSRPLPDARPISQLTDAPVEIPPFDYDPRTRLVFGAGTVAKLGEHVRKLGGQRVLLVTDAGLRDAGHEQLALQILADAGVSVVVYDDVHTNPTSDDIDAGAAFARRHEIDLLIGLGGGSSMDCAKGINFVITNGGKIEDYWGIGKATKPMLPLICVPTTAGTGSEAQSFAVIAHPQTHLKMACGDKKAAARVAILDPNLTLSMPAPVTAATGIDALSHALETYVTTRRTPVSQIFSHQAWQLLSRAFPAVLHAPQDRPARGAMLLGSYLAGAAIENSMLGATHASANPLTAHYDLTHGVAIGLMLPHVIRYNAGVATAGTANWRPMPGYTPVIRRRRHLAGFVTRLVVRSGGLTTPPSAASIHPDSDLAASGRQWTGKSIPSRRRLRGTVPMRLHS